MPELLLKDEVYAIVGAAMEVYNALGSGFFEAVYQEALEIELSERCLPFESQKELHIFYKGRQLEKTYLTDVIAYGQVIVELKAISRLTSPEEAQLLNYLKATGLPVGVLINFGAADKLEWKRMVKTRSVNSTAPLQKGICLPRRILPRNLYTNHTNATNVKIAQSIFRAIRVIRVPTW